MQNARKTILVVDDDANILKALSLRLRSSGFNVLTAPDGTFALALVAGTRPDLVITDIWMSLGAGFFLAYRLKQTMPGVPFIFLTASKKAELREMAEQMGAAAFLEKPYEPESLLAAVHAALQQAEAAIPDDSLSASAEVAGLPVAGTR